jgi:hypothetical protein
MIEALILWQIVGARSDERVRRQDRPDGYSFYVGMVAVAFIFTIFAWPVNAIYRTGLLRWNKYIAIFLAVSVYALIATGAPVFFLGIGFLWACCELAAWMERQERM